MFVIKSLRRNLGMLYFVYRVMYEFDTDFQSTVQKMPLLP